MHFVYGGEVLSEAGAGLLYVGARGTWYPNRGLGMSNYDLEFRYPPGWVLVATGRRIDSATTNRAGDQIEGQQVSRWISEGPIPLAGFNLGEYALASVSVANYSVDVYANRQLEQALAEQLRANILDPIAEMPRPFGSPQTTTHLSLPPLPPPSPAGALKQLARDIDSSIRFYETYSGPFPARQLSVSQIPGSFGQGWPGLLYLSTYSFLSTSAQQRAGLSTSGQEHFHDLVPFHEVAHQWWGNVVTAGEDPYQGEL